MKRFRSLIQLRSDDSHYQVDKIAGHLRPSHHEFPRAALREYTDSVIRKQKGIAIPDGIDLLLSEFIREHRPLQKDVALAACAHNMSGDCIIGLLTGHLKPQPDDLRALETFLECLIAVEHNNLSCVSAEDIRHARELLFLIRNSKYARTSLFQPVLAMFHRGVPASGLLAPHMIELLEGSGKEHQADLKTLKETGQWAHAYTMAKWLAEIPPSIHAARLGLLNAGQVLDSAFPSWKSWASWKPSIETLIAFSEKIFSPDRTALRDILSLEGPCDPHYVYPTLRDQIAATATSGNFSSGSIRFAFRNHNPEHLQKRLKKLMGLAIEAATHGSTSDKSRMSMFSRFCLGSPISEASLKILDVTFSNGDSRVIRAADDIFEAFDKKREPPHPQLLIMLEACIKDEELAKIFGASVRQNVVQVFKLKQAELKSIANARRSWSAADQQILVQLFNLGKRINAGLESFVAILDDNQKLLLDQWPDDSQINICHNLLIELQHTTAGVYTSLTTKIIMYLVAKMAEPNVVSDSTLLLVGQLIALWLNTISADSQAVALTISKDWCNVKDTTFLCHCISSLITLPLEDTKVILDILNSTPSKGDACKAFARYLTRLDEPELIRTWSEILFQMLEREGENLMDWAMQSLSVSAWFEWMDDLAGVFAHKFPWDDTTKSPFLKTHLQQWMHVIIRHKGVLERLEEDDSIINGPSMSCLLKGGDELLQAKLQNILEILETNYSEAKWGILQNIVARLHAEGENAEIIRHAMVRVGVILPSGEDAMAHVLETYETRGPEIAEVMLYAWHTNPELMPDDMYALEALATVLGLEIGSEVPLDSLQTIETWFQDQFRELAEEARRLESLRLAFRNVDPISTRTMLQELHIQDSDPVDDLLLDLPVEIIDVVEKVGENEVEMTVPLTGLTALQLKAMGAGESKNLIVRLSPGGAGFPPGFCMHFDAEERSYFDTDEHSLCLVLGDKPEEHACHGKLTPGVYQLSRLLSEMIREKGSLVDSLPGLYAFLTAEITTLGSKCIVCGVMHGFRVKRSTVCADRKCLATYENSHIDVRLADIRMDPAAVDLLLTAIYASATNGRQANDLLTGCPITAPEKILQIFRSMPKISQLSSDLTMNLPDHFDSNISIDAVKLMFWACSSYKGFLCSVPSNLKVPSMPGAHQFILINASPKQELDFSARIRGGSSKVMFHGTNMERLNAILREGLRDLSGSALQRHGQSYGKGVYLSTEPSTAWGYTYACTSWSKSNYQNCRVLLGVELAGTWSPSSGNIYVISDPACVMVRYVFLMPPTATVPIANHVVPAMQIAYNSLRNGAV